MCQCHHSSVVAFIAFMHLLQNSDQNGNHTYIIKGREDFYYDSIAKWVSTTLEIEIHIEISGDSSEIGQWRTKNISHVLQVILMHKCNMFSCLFTWLFEAYLWLKLW